jgi:hypothetical protein
MTGKIDINEALVTAASEGRTDKILKLLVEGADINYTNPHGTTALVGAARGGHDDLVERLIGKGADIEAKNDDGQTPLISEAFWGHKETIKLLINQGANIEARDDEGHTALMVAAMEDETETLKLLLKKGANIEAKSDDFYSGGTALMLAAKKGNSDTVKLLLRNGADIEAKDERGNTALDLVMMDEILDDEPDSCRTEIMALLKSKTTMEKRKTVSEEYRVINEIKKASERDMSGWKTFPIEELFQTKAVDDKDEIAPGKSIQPGAKGPIPVPVYAAPEAGSTPNEPEKKNLAENPVHSERAKRRQ